MPPDSESRVVECKCYHQPVNAASGGSLRRHSDAKSRCPQWAADRRVQQALLADAIAVPRAGTDSFGRTKKLANALLGVAFIGVSTNEAVPPYNCYPIDLGPLLRKELAERAKRTLDDLSLSPQDRDS